MYVYTIIGTFILGIWIIFFGDTMANIFAFPPQDKIMHGVAGSMYLSFGVVSIFALFNPIRFVPILLVQMGYKVIWFAFIFIPELIKGNIDTYAILLAIGFATYIIGDILAIPFKMLFSKKSE
jgi:hypothetical protein